MLLSAELNRSQKNRFFSCAQTPSSPGSKPVSPPQQGGTQQGYVCPSHPCQVPDPQPTTRFSSGLSGLLSWKYSTAFWILSMQFKYSSSLPVGLKIKPKIKSSECPKKQRKKIPRKHQTKFRIKITRTISIPFSSTRRRSWDSVLRLLSATAEHPIHAASAEVLMMEQHTTFSLAFLSQSGLHGKVWRKLHIPPQRRAITTSSQRLKAGSRTGLIHPGWRDNINRAGRTFGKRMEERREATNAHRIHGSLPTKPGRDTSAESKQTLPSGDC